MSGIRLGLREAGRAAAFMRRMEAVVARVTGLVSDPGNLPSITEVRDLDSLSGEGDPFARLEAVLARLPTPSASAGFAAPGNARQRGPEVVTRSASRIAPPFQTETRVAAFRSVSGVRNPTAGPRREPAPAPGPVRTPPASAGALAGAVSPAAAARRLASRLEARGALDAFRSIVSTGPSGGSPKFHRSPRRVLRATQPTRATVLGGGAPLEPGQLTARTLRRGQSENTLSVPRPDGPPSQTGAGRGADRTIPTGSSHAWTDAISTATEPGWDLSVPAPHRATAREISDALAAPGPEHAGTDPHKVALGRAGTEAARSRRSPGTARPDAASRRSVPVEPARTAVPPVAETGLRRLAALATEQLPSPHADARRPSENPARSLQFDRELERILQSEARRNGIDLSEFAS